MLSRVQHYSKSVKILASEVKQKSKIGGEIKEDNRDLINRKKIIGWLVDNQNNR